MPWRRDRLPTPVFLGFPVTQLVNNPSAMWETWVQSLGWEDPLEEGKATHSSILAYAVHGATKSGDTTERLSYGTTKILKHFKSLKNFSTFILR